MGSYCRSLESMFSSVWSLLLFTFYFSTCFFLLCVFFVFSPLFLYILPLLCCYVVSC
jgi:hypothetical protein